MNPLCVIACLSLVAPAHSQGDATNLARQVLNASGVRTGLALHLGCGSEATPGLTAALASQSQMLVHGLALDRAACDRARAAIAEADVAGRAMVECVPVNPLPYLNDLANLVVVEDRGALERGGVSRAEVIRVLAPGGALCIREGGKWTTSTKPRPKEMDDWTHPQHGPDGNMVSADRLIKFPLGFRWLAGLPININRWASTRGWIVAHGRVFELTSSVVENIGPSREKPHHLVARDAWNGLPLWKLNLGTTDDGAFLTHQNAGPLVADDSRVYAAQADKAIGVDAVTGEVVATYATKHMPVRLLLLDGVLIAVCWQGREPSKAVFDRTSLWATWSSVGSVGSVEAYEAATGKQLWSLSFAAETAIAADGAAYLLRQVGNPPTEREVVAVDLRTGKERWRVSSKQFGQEADLHPNCAGAGYVVVARKTAGQILGLSPVDGSVLWKIDNAKSTWTPVVDGLLWHGLKKYDPRTGEEKGNVGTWIGNQGCTPSTIVNNIVTRSRGCSYTLLPAPGAPADAKPESAVYRGARGGCMEGMVPANGMFYTSQNWCRCAPGQVYGFIALGPSGEWPSAAEFAKPRPVEKGPAFDAFEVSATATEDWPMYRHDPARSGASAASVPAKLNQTWRRKLVSTDGGSTLSGAWMSRLASPLTAPVIANGRVFVAKGDLGQVVVLDAESGDELWCVSLGSRLDTPPTIHGGLAFVGCHDGYVYALRATDGQLAWRTRVAPWERRMVAFGMVESVWPVVGTLALHGGKLFACAGRTSESDGGVAIVALDPATGQQVWARSIGPGPLRQNDILRYDAGALLWRHLWLDPDTGEGNVTAPAKKTDSQGGLFDGTWTQIGKRRTGLAFQYSKARGDLLAWSDALVVGPMLAVSRRKALFAAELKPTDYRWRPQLPKTYQVEAVALAGNAALFAGRNLQASGDQARGFLVACSLADGKPVAEIALAAPPTYDGIAVAEGGVFVSLYNGELLCFGS